MDLLNTNSTAPHFIGSTRPDWWTQQTHHHLSKKPRYSQEWLAANAERVRLEGNTTSHGPNCHQDPLSSTGLPSPAPSHESEKHTPEMSAASGVFQLGETHTIAAQQAPSTNVGPRSFLDHAQLPTDSSSLPTPSLGTYDSVAHTSVQQQAQRLSRIPSHSMWHSPSMPHNPYGPGQGFAVYPLFYRPDSCNAQIRNYINILRQHPLPPLTQAHIMVVQEAVARQPQDVFYLVLLQVFCSNTVAPTQLPQPFAGDYSMQQSLQLLKTIMFFPNTNLEKSFYQFFADFPAHISHVLAVEQGPTRDIVMYVAEFLRRLAKQLPAIEKTVQERGFPLNVDEMYHSLGMLSPLVQRSFVTHLCVKVLNITSQEMNQQIQKLAIRRWDEFVTRRLPFLTERRASRDRQAAWLRWRDDMRHMCRPSEQSRAAEQVTVPTQLAVPAVLPTVAQVRSAHQSNIGSNPAAIRTRGGISQTSMNAASTTSQHAHVFLRPGQPYTRTAEPAPHIYNLFQAHLIDRQMKLELQDADPAHKVPLYQAVSDYPLVPQQFATDICQHEFHFDISKEDFSNMSRTFFENDRTPAKKLVAPTNSGFRFRCVLINKPYDSIGLLPWLDKATYWPQNILFTCNEKPLELRRSAHWHKDLPVDLDICFVKPGRNTIKIHINKPKAYKTERLAVAVEKIGFATLDEIVSAVKSRFRIAEDIKTSLHGKQARSSPMAGQVDQDHDDDLIVVSNTVQISVIDPVIQQGLCQVPVRSELCRHRDCFDLETYLHSRIRKPDNDAYEVDTWTCPICKSYAGPAALFVDGFMVAVNEELKNRGQLDTRTIVLNEDGSWAAKEEAKEQEERRPATAREDSPARRRTETPVQAIVIDLD